MANGCVGAGLGGCDLCEEPGSVGLWTGSLYGLEGLICDGCRGELRAESRRRRNARARSRMAANRARTRADLEAMRYRGTGGAEDMRRVRMAALPKIPDGLRPEHRAEKDKLVRERSLALVADAKEKGHRYARELAMSLGVAS